MSRLVKNIQQCCHIILSCIKSVGKLGKFNIKLSTLIDCDQVQCLDQNWFNLFTVCENSDAGTPMQQDEEDMLTFAKWQRFSQSQHLSVP